jgi:protein tyrosine/serine phosphatase
MGVRTVINLRTRHSEKAEVEAAGMRSVEIPMNSMKNIDPAAVRKALSVMTDPANRPVLVHCAHGKDRTGVVVAVYRMKIEGWSEAQAEAEMEAFGFHEVWFQFKKFLRRYAEEGRP